MHLKQELTEDPIAWVNSKLKKYPPRATTTSYDVDRDLQAKLAAMRTDLDSFSEVEAHALMASGYQMTRREFERLNEEHLKRAGGGTWGGFDVHAPSRGPGFWKFLELALLLALPKESSDRRRTDLGRQLDAGSSRFLKAFKISPALGAVGIALLALVIAVLGYVVCQNWHSTVELSGTFGGMLLTLLIIVGGLLWRGLRLANPQAVMRSWLLKSALALGGWVMTGWVMTNFHLGLVDPVFIKRGKLQRLMRLP